MAGLSLGIRRNSGRSIEIHSRLECPGGRDQLPSGHNEDT